MAIFLHPILIESQMKYVTNANITAIVLQVRACSEETCPNCVWLACKCTITLTPPGSTERHSQSTVSIHCQSKHFISVHITIWWICQFTCECLLNTETDLMCRKQREETVSLLVEALAKVKLLHYKCEVSMTGWVLYIKIWLSDWWIICIVNLHSKSMPTETSARDQWLTKWLRYGVLYYQYERVTSTVWTWHHSLSLTEKTHTRLLHIHDKNQSLTHYLVCHLSTIVISWITYL